MIQLSPLWIKILKITAATAAGALLGFLYYRFIGCRTGSCPITSSPWRTSLYGAVAGFLIGWV